MARALPLAVALAAGAASLLPCAVRASAAGGADAQLVFASLERTGCYGPCPIYRVDVLGDGTVVYEGRQYVKHKGLRQARLTAERLAELDRAFEDAGFLALDASYGRTDVMDRSYVTVAYATTAGSANVRYPPDDPNVPAALARLEGELERIVELERWVGTEAERDALARRRPLVDDAIFRCTAEVGKYRGRFVLDELGWLQLQGWRGEERFACRLDLEELSYAPDAVVGNVTLRMRLAACRGVRDAPFEDRSLQREMSLVVKLFQSPRQGSVDWIAHAQPSPCVIETFDEESVRDAARDFAEKLRLPASPGPSTPDASARLAAAMLRAVERGDVVLVRRLVRYPAAAGATNRQGQAPLAVAAIWNDGPRWLEIARELARSGASLDARDGDGLTALGHAEGRARRGEGGPAAEMVALLLKAGADPSASRLSLKVGDRAVELDHRTMMSAGCLLPPAEPTCDAARALPRATTRGLERKGGANPGALVCARLGGQTVIARHSNRDEDALCAFADGSVVLAGRLHEIAVQNDLAR